MYELLDEPVDTSKIWPWDQIIPDGLVIIGYSWAGDFFLANKSGTGFGVLLTHGGNYEAIPVSSIEEFENGFLAADSIRTAVLRESEIEQLVARLGRPLANEVFFPVPYPWLGGSGNLESYAKGDVWVYASLAGQSHGLDTR
jgi:hypothetical protein